MIKGKQRLLANVLHHSQALRLFRHGANRLIVFNYHRIRPDENYETDFDPGVFGPTAAQFEDQVVWLKRNTQILSEADIINVVNGQRPLPALAAMITFDDGYRDNYDVAYPILRRHGVPAIFFISTARQLGWWDLVAYVINKCSKPTILYKGEHIAREDATSYLLRKIKLVPNEDMNELLPALANTCEVALPDRAAQEAELMTWEQIREASQHGIAIGSHTHSHRVLSALSPEMQREELITSKTVLQHELGKQVHALSYPHGNYEHFTIDTRSIAAECGYELAFSFNTGTNVGGLISRHDIKRVGAPESVEMLAAMTMLPGVFARAK